MGCVLTMVGTGSEMNAGAVITNPHTHQKIGQSVGAYTNATHGMTLAAVSLLIIGIFCLTAYRSSNALP